MTAGINISNKSLNWDKLKIHTQRKTSKHQNKNIDTKLSKYNTYKQLINYKKLTMLMIKQSNATTHWLTIRNAKYAKSGHRKQIRTPQQITNKICKHSKNSRNIIIQLGNSKLQKRLEAQLNQNNKMNEHKLINKAFLEYAKEFNKRHLHYGHGLAITDIAVHNDEVHNGITNIHAHARLVSYYQSKTKEIKAHVTKSGRFKKAHLKIGKLNFGFSRGIRAEFGGKSNRLALHILRNQEDRELLNTFNHTLNTNMTLTRAHKRTNYTIQEKSLTNNLEHKASAFAKQSITKAISAHQETKHQRNIQIANQSIIKAQTNLIHAKKNHVKQLNKSIVNLSKTLKSIQNQIIHIKSKFIKFTTELTKSTKQTLMDVANQNKNNFKELQSANAKTINKANSQQHNVLGRLISTFQLHYQRNRAHSNSIALDESIANHDFNLKRDRMSYKRNQQYLYNTNNYDEAKNAIEPTLDSLRSSVSSTYNGATLKFYHEHLASSVTKSKAQSAIQSQAQSIALSNTKSSEAKATASMQQTKQDHLLSQLSLETKNSRKAHEITKNRLDNNFQNWKTQHPNQYQTELRNYNQSQGPTRN